MCIVTLTLFFILHIRVCHFKVGLCLNFATLSLSALYSDMDWMSKQFTCILKTSVTNTRNNMDKKSQNASVIISHSLIINYKVLVTIGKFPQSGFNVPLASMPNESLCNAKWARQDFFKSTLIDRFYFKLYIFRYIWKAAECSAPQNCTFFLYYPLTP